jgi:hypothetical protein
VRWTMRCDWPPRVQSGVGRSRGFERRQRRRRRRRRRRQAVGWRRRGSERRVMESKASQPRSSASARRVLLVRAHNRTLLALTKRAAHLQPVDPRPLRSTRTGPACLPCPRPLAYTRPYHALRLMSRMASLVSVRDQQAAAGAPYGLCVLLLPCNQPLGPYDSPAHVRARLQSARVVPEPSSPPSSPTTAREKQPRAHQSPRCTCMHPLTGAAS